MLSMLYVDANATHLACPFIARCNCLSSNTVGSHRNFLCCPEKYEYEEDNEYQGHELMANSSEEEPLASRFRRICYCRSSSFA